MKPLSLFRLILFGAVIGIPAALAAIAFFTAVHDLERLLWTDLPANIGLPSPPWFMVIGLPMMGALIVAAARTLLPGDGGRSPLDGMSEGSTPVAFVPGIVVAALGTLAFGLVLGPEAPVMAVGSAVGVALTSRLRGDPEESRPLSTAGVFSAISTLFGGPLVAGVMLTEGGLALGAALVPALLPGFVAAAVGYLIFIGVGPYTGAPAPGLTLPDLEAYTGTSVPDLVVAIAVGVLTGALIVVVNRAAGWFSVAEHKRLGRKPGVVVIILVAGGFAVGLLALLASSFGVDPEDVLFSGQSSIPALVSEETFIGLVVLVAAKALGYVISLASGFRGGPIFPAIFLGIGLAAFPVQWFDLSPTVAIAIGAAAGMVAHTRLVVTSMLFAGLLVGTAGFDAIPAAVFATVASYLTVSVIDPPRPPGVAHSVSTPKEDGRT